MPRLQAPILYNWGLDEVSLVTRVTAVQRSMMMLGGWRETGTQAASGALIPFNLNPMSVFTFSVRLLVEGDYIHPGYQMDDIIAFIRCPGIHSPPCPGGGACSPGRGATSCAS
jgi:hypothetical protein